jgi:hypothetical protein
VTTYHRLFENTPTSTFVSTGTLTSAFNWGNKFQAPGAGFVSALGFFRVAGSSTPGHLQLWNVGTGDKLADLTSLTVPAEGAWGFTNLPTPIALEAGTTYLVCAYQANSSVGTQGAQTDWVAADNPPLLRDDASRTYVENATTIPNVDQTTPLGNADIGWTDDGTPWPGGTPPAGGGGTTNADLAAWLSSQSEVNSHQEDGLPWLTKALLDAWNSGLGAGATGYFQFMKTALAAVKERTDRLPDSIEALTNAILDNASDNVDLVLAGLATRLVGRSAPSPAALRSRQPDGAWPTKPIGTRTSPGRSRLICTCSP